MSGPELPRDRAIRELRGTAGEIEYAARHEQLDVVATADAIALVCRILAAMLEDGSV